MLGVPARGVAVRNAGSAEPSDRRWSIGRDDVLAPVPPVGGGAVAVVTGPLHGDLVGVLMVGHCASLIVVGPTARPRAWETVTNR